MPSTITHQKLVALQKHIDNIRNLCILAHVDHGKTTLADSLIASNGIIAERLAGKLRYLDCLAEEQERGITMKASSISLYYSRNSVPNDAGCTKSDEYLINLIDSPGHVDFSTEVSTAVRLCDGALVIVDAVEGCSSQTVQVLRQAWQEKIKPVLVINKIDRLILETKKSSGEAYNQMRKILEDVNAVVGELFRGEIIATEEERHLYATGKLGEHEEQEDANFTLPDFADEEVEGLYFAPEHGNVLFASAIDGWAFRLSHFARLWASRLGINTSEPARIARLEKAMWGDYWLNVKQKRIEPGALSKGKKPLFEQLVLDSIWQVYQHVIIQRDIDQIEKIVKNLGLKSVGTAAAAAKDHRAHLQSIFRQWLPLSNAVLECCVDRLPSPASMSNERAERLMLRSAGAAFRDLPEPTRAIKQAFIQCSSENSASVPCIVYISKVFAVTSDQIMPDSIANAENEQSNADVNGILTHGDEQRHRLKHLRALAASALQQQQHNGDGFHCDTDAGVKNSTDAENPPSSDQPPAHPYQFIAFARVFSGTIQRGQSLYFLGPKHDPHEALKLQANGDKNIPHVTEVEIKQLFMLMGRHMEPVACVPAGNICGIGGLDDVVIRSGTLSSTLACPAFTDLFSVSKPIVAVSVEPSNPLDVAKLTRGMRLLLQADPCVEAHISQSGEHVMITAGEVHLERCVDDLRKRYARVPLHVSEPSVPFRETIALTIPDNVLQQHTTANVASKQQHATKSATPENLHLSKFDRQRDIRTIRQRTSDGRLMLEFEAVPLSRAAANLLEQSAEILRRLMSSEKRRAENDAETKDLMEFKQNLLKKLLLDDENAAPIEKFGDFMTASEMLDRIIAFGPKYCGSNMLVCALPSVSIATLQELGIGAVNWRSTANNTLLERAIDEKTDAKTLFETEFIKRFARSVINGFQLTAAAGPLCEEPLMGVCFMLKQVVQLQGKPASDEFVAATRDELEKNAENAETAGSVETGAVLGEVDDDFEIIPAENDEIKNISSVDEIRNSSVAEEINFLSSGPIIAATKDACRRLVQQSAPRLVVATYRCRIQASADVLGKLYSVLARRQGQILAEEMQEGTQLFNVDAELPVAESFGFAEEVRRRTSGHASAFVQLVFSHWTTLEELDPYWVPGDAGEQDEDDEDNSDDETEAEIGHNLALTYMNRVRKRKGLSLYGEKLVKHAEKQRTLNKKK